MKKLFSLVFRTSISLALLVLLFSKIDLNSTLKVALSADPFYFILCVIAFTIVYIFAFYRWAMLLAAQGISLPLLRVVSSYSGGLFFSLFLPSTIGGDIARSIDLGMHTRRKSVVAATVLLDRLSGFVGLVIVAIIALIFGHNFIAEPVVYFMVLFLIVFLGTVLLVIFNKKIYNRINRADSDNGGLRGNLKKLHTELHFFRSKPRILVLNLVYSIIIQGGSSLISYLILRSLHVKIKAIYPLVFNPVISTITTLPISIGGLGLRDASSLFFYTKVGVPKDVVFAQSLLNFSLILAFGLIAGIVYVSTLHYRRLQPHQTGSKHP